MQMWAFWTNGKEEGQDLVEYALLAGLMAVAVVAAMPTLNAAAGALLSRVGSVISTGF
ncbi:MAG: Flp family type IVb pilin [Bryobacteraceae bacterium]